MKILLNGRNTLVGNVLIALTLGFLLTALPCTAATRIRLAQPVLAMMFAPLYFGVDQSIFAGEGYELEFMTMRTDLAIAALGTGDIDYITHGGAALRAAAQGFPLKLVFALDHKTPFWLAARSQIKNVRQLAGKKSASAFPVIRRRSFLNAFSAGRVWIPTAMFPMSLGNSHPQPCKAC